MYKSSTFLSISLYSKATGTKQLVRVRRRFVASGRLDPNDVKSHYQVELDHECVKLHNDLRIVRSDVKLQ